MKSGEINDPKVDNSFHDPPPNYAGPIMLNLYNQSVRPIVNSFGIDIVRHDKNAIDPYCDFSVENRRIYEAVKPFTMTTPERVNALIEGVRYIVRSGIEGDFVECGVWKGGSSMAIALTLLEMGVSNRGLHLYDTFSGMNAPTDDDVSVTGTPAEQKFSKTKLSDDSSDWCMSPVEEVKENIRRTGYPEHHTSFVQGKVEDTIPGHLPSSIALLRLDTDWYESTKHEMQHLYPLLNTNGVLIIDDYGHWAGARKAVDEYFAANKIELLLNRIDYTGRIALKSKN